MSNSFDSTPTTPTAVSTTASPSTRRSTRPMRSSDTPKPRLASSLEDTEMSRSMSNSGNSSRRKNMITQSNPRPWMHPEELRYICDVDFPQSVLIQYLCSRAFSIPPRETNSTIPLFNVTTRDGTAISLPRGYRVPLMFVAYFQWDSLKLVLTASDPQKEWEEYRFDIIHLCRLCERLFSQATEAQKQVGAGGAKGMDRLWRSSTFDRVLTRFYHRWFVSREWSIRKFWEEFDDDEYDGDVLKHDWVRWALKGHKGFTLTKDQILRGITAQEFMQGLSKNSQGTWIWAESLPVSSGSLSSHPSIDDFLSSSSQDPMVVEDEPGFNGITIAQLEEVFDVRGAGTPSHNTIEVKKERLELAEEDLPTTDKQEIATSGTSISTPTNQLVGLDTIAASATPVADRRVSDHDSITNQPQGMTSPTVGQKRPRMIIQARKSAPFCYKKRKTNPENSSPVRQPVCMPRLDFRQLSLGQGLFGRSIFSFDSPRDKEEESSSSEDDDPKDGDYRAPRKSKAKPRQRSAKFNSTTRRDHAPNPSPKVIVKKSKQTTSAGPIGSRSTGSSSNPPVIATEFRVVSASIQPQGLPRGVVNPSTMAVKPSTTSEPAFPIPDRVTSSLPSSPPVMAMSSAKPPGPITAPVARSEMVLPPAAEALPISESHESVATPGTSELASAEHGAVPSSSFFLAPQDRVDNLSNVNNQDGSLAFPPSSPCSSQPSDVPQTNKENVADEMALKENVSNVLPAAEIEMNDSPSLNITPTQVVGPEGSVDQHSTSDPTKSSANEEPDNSVVESETSPHTENVSPGVSLASPISKQDDQMEVDESVALNDRVEGLHEMLTSLLSDPRQMKVRRGILLMRGILRDQRIQSGSIPTSVDDELSISTRFPSSLPDLRYANGNEPFTMEEHLELVAKCSTLLSKYATVYKGRELEERMVELDERLQQELSNMGTASEVGIGSNPPRRVDKEVATSELSNQGQAIAGNEQVEKVDELTQDPAPDAATIQRQSLTPDATMVDLSSVPPTTSTGSDILKLELISGTMPLTPRLMTSMMRNLADLLDYTCGGDDAKGKGQALDITSPTTGGAPYDLTLATPLLNEFKSMKEEIRTSQQRSKEEIDSIARLHRVEMMSLKEQMRATEDKYRRETELLRQHHRDEMVSLMGSIGEAEKRKEKVDLEAEGILPALEMLELRRRLTALESHTRSPNQAGPSSRPVCDDESDVTIIRRAPFHPLGHLFDYEDAASPVAYRSSPDGVTSASKPGTPFQSEASNAVFIDSIPLPIKSQRKFQSMHRMSMT